MPKQPNRQRAKVPSARKIEVWKRDKYRCRYCKAAVCNPSPDLSPDRWATVDHVRPRSQGGKNTMKNLVTACQRCNQRKASIPVSQFVKNGGAPGATVWEKIRMGYSPLAAAKAMEARRAETGTGSVEDDSAARQGLPETSLGGSNDR
jgi:hypothetical protein